MRRVGEEESVQASQRMQGRDAPPPPVQPNQCLDAVNTDTERPRDACNEETAKRRLDEEAAQRCGD
jgi:hypothetical protein